MKASEIITDRVRPMLDDTKEPKTWSDAVLLALLNDGVTDLSGRRPDALVSPTGTLLAIVECTSLTSDVSINADFRLALAHFIVAHALMFKSADPQMVTRSSAHWKLYLEQL